MGFLTGFSDTVSKTYIQQYSVFKAASTIQESILPSNTLTNSCFVEFFVRKSSYVFCRSIILQGVLWLHLFLTQLSACLPLWSDSFNIILLLNFLLREAVDDLRKANSLLFFPPQITVLYFFHRIWIFIELYKSSWGKTLKRLWQLIRYSLLNIPILSEVKLNSLFLRWLRGAATKFCFMVASLSLSLICFFHILVIESEEAYFSSWMVHILIWRFKPSQI